MASVLAARLRSIPKHIRAIARMQMPLPSVDSDPTNPIAWISAAQRIAGDLPPRSRALMSIHGLDSKDRLFCFFAEDIRRSAGPMLLELSKLPVTPQTIAAAVDQIVKWKGVAQSAYSHRAGKYFEESEAVIDTQWRNTIWPIIQNCDFTHVLDLACGHGRNTTKLHPLAKTVSLVDINKSCIDACRHRFGMRIDQCSFTYHVNNGTSLASIPSTSISLVYCWDSMVHFDKIVVRDYLQEIERVLAPGGHAFLHHSNLGAINPESDHLKNHGSRSNMSAQAMQDFSREIGLTVAFQRLSGLADGWGMDDIDCLSLLVKKN